MAASTLPAAQLARLRKELPRIESEMQLLARDAELMVKLIDHLDERALLKRSGESAERAKRVIRQAETSLTQALSLLSSAPRGAPAAGPGGKPVPTQDLGDIKAWVARLPKRMSSLGAAVRRYERSARDKLGEPGRWGDAAELPQAVKGVFDLISMLLEITAKLLKRYR
jgi:hypothetical protein